MALYEDTLARIEALIKQSGNPTAIARRSGFSQPAMSDMFGEKAQGVPYAERRDPRFSKICKLLETLGAKIVFPGDTALDEIPKEIEKTVIRFASDLQEGIDLPSALRHAAEHLNALARAREASTPPGPASHRRAAG